MKRGKIRFFAVKTEDTGEKYKKAY